jgi:(p)ppGpp synthase/HD superfamily hydrolase
MNNKIIIAEQFAKMSHYGQVRKFTGEPYYEHPMRVALMATEFNLSINEIVTCWLHDTIEDTTATEEQIIRYFGNEVNSLVQELTSNKEESQKVGKTQYLISKIKGMSNQAFTIKLLDRLDNVTNITLAPEKFAKKYYIETKEIIDNIEPRCNNDIIIINKIIEAINPVYEMYWS